MKCCLIHELLDCVYIHLLLKVGLRVSDKSFHISYLYIEYFYFYSRFYTCPHLVLHVTKAHLISPIQWVIFRNFLYRDMKCGIICQSHTAKLPVLNGRKCSPTFYESSNISFNISYLGYY